MNIFLCATFLTVSNCLWLCVLHVSGEESCAKNNKSPIPLTTKNAETHNEMGVTFDSEYFQFFNGTVMNTGQFIELQFLEEEEPPHIKLSLTKEKFILARGYIIWLSEHTIFGKRYDAALHLVHYREEYGSLKNARTKLHGLFVLARLYEITETPNLFYEPLIEAITKTAHKPMQPVNISGSLLPVLPVCNRSFFAYRGSYLAPSCEDTVIWQVYTHPSHVSKSQYERMTTIYDRNDTQIKSNNKKLELDTDHVIYYKDSKCC